jgi:cob(I)alamin adenosyltransferase
VKIYTRTGDTGDTSLFGGTRVRKSDGRVDAYGEVDELNAWLGLVRASRLDAEFDAELVQIQRDLFALGAQLADPSDTVASRAAKASLGDADVARLERTIDRLEAGLPPLRRFILAGGSPAGAALHVARTVCRRAERRIVALQPPADPMLVRYVNRLSDLLFVLARAVNQRADAAETEWAPTRPAARAPASPHRRPLAPVPVTHAPESHRTRRAS